MAPITTLFSAAMAFFSTVSAAPLVVRQHSPYAPASAVDASAPMKLFYIPRVAETDTDGSAISGLLENQSKTWLTIRQPSGPATRNQRYLAVTDGQADAWNFTMVGGYIQAWTPTNQTWSSINDPLYSSTGGQVWFTSYNEGADGGLTVDESNGAIYLNREESATFKPNYAIWKTCWSDDANAGPPVPSFNGTQTQSCQDVYLVGCNNGNCPADTAA